MFAKAPHLRYYIIVPIHMNVWDKKVSILVLLHHPPCPRPGPADHACHAALELATLVASKYGKKYDVTIARRTFAGKDFVSLNVMWCEFFGLLLLPCAQTCPWTGCRL